MDTTVNNNDSQNDVVSTHSHVLFAFENMIRKEMPNSAVVFDPKLSYETAMKQFYANNESDQDPLPLFAYMRSVSRPAEDAPARRGRNYTGNLKHDDGIISYKATHDEFDVNFMYITKSIESLERFEVVYNSDEGISGTKEITVPMGDLGEFKYFLDFQELTDIEVESENTFYKGLAGSLKIRGFYFTFRATSGIIKNIVTQLKSANDLDKKEESEIVGGSQESI